MVIEPLPAFFILEGIAIDVIGTILLAKGIFAEPDLSNESQLAVTQREVDELHESTDLIELKMDKINKKMFSGRGDNNPNMKLFKKWQEYADRYTHQYEKLSNKTNQFFMESLLFSNAIKHENVLLKTRSAFPFLIGGFLLQGIGVIAQLW